MGIKPASRPPWSASLAQALRGLKRTDAPPRVAVVGIGNALRGDDGAGVAVARVLSQRLESGQSLLVIDAGFAPENQIGPVRRFRPDLVLLVDAAQMGLAPGAVRWLSWSEAEGLSASTHTLPPAVLARYLTEALGCRVALLGIQPGRNAFGAPFSAEVWEAVVTVAQTLEEVLGGSQCETSIHPPAQASISR